VLEQGECEVESFASRSREAGQPHRHGVSLQLGCGIGLRSQIALGASGERSQGSRDRAWALAGKFALIQGGEDGVSSALAWGLTAERPAGAGAYRLEERLLQAVATAPLAKGLQVHANLGHSHSRSARQGTTGWALALEHETTPSVSLMVETFGSDRDRRPWVQLAVRWAAVPDRLFLDASWGLQTTANKPTQATFGLKMPF